MGTGNIAVTKTMRSFSLLFYILEEEEKRPKISKNMHVIQFVSIAISNSINDLRKTIYKCMISELQPEWQGEATKRKTGRE